MSVVTFTPNPKAGIVSGDTRPLRRQWARLDGRSRPAKRVAGLISAFRKALGPAANAPHVTDKIRECAELQGIVEAMRRAALTGIAIDLKSLNRLQGTLARLRRQIGLGGLDLPQIEDSTGLSADMTSELAELFKRRRRRSR